MICPFCKKEILLEDEKFMYPIEVPYANVYFHRICYRENRAIIPKILQENVDLWYNNKEKSTRNTKK